ncbi:MAG: hypothetical protein AABX86_02995, partial [Nanoarchaeota archaeon]
STVWFLDNTPTDSAEWSTCQEASADLGVGSVVTGRWCTSASGSATKADIWSVALHEMGHTLGLTTSLSTYYDETFFDSNVMVTSPRPFAGSVIKTVPLESHLNYPQALMTESFSNGMRYLPSEADILAIAEVNEYVQINLNPI